MPATLRKMLIVFGVIAMAFAADGMLNAGRMAKLLINDAEAVRGRPLTPLSYAGVARRTTRRAIYRTSMYVATLPRGCTTVVVSGATLHQCGATYYQPHNGQYVIINVK